MALIQSTTSTPPDFDMDKFLDEQGKKATFTQTYSPTPLSTNNQQIKAQQTWNQTINPTLKVNTFKIKNLVKKTSGKETAKKQVQYIKDQKSMVYASAEQEAQQLAAKALSPISTAHQIAGDAFKYGATAYTATHLKSVSNLLRLNPALTAGLGLGYLLSGPTRNKLRYYENQVLGWSHPEYIAKQKINQKVKQNVLQAVVPFLSKPLVAAGYSLGLLDDVKTPHQWDPSVEVASHVFKPTRWLHQKPADFFEKQAKKSQKKYVKDGLKLHADKLRQRRRRSLLDWLLYPLALLTGAGFEILLAYLEQFSPQLVSLLRGYSLPILKAIPSLNTGLSGWGTSRLLDQIAPQLNPRLNLFGLKIPLGGLVGGAGGAYYQSLLNLSNRFHASQLSIFKSNKFLSSQNLRFEIMPKSYLNQFGSNYWNKAPAMDQFIKDYGYKLPGTQFHGQAGTAQYQFLEAKYLSQKGLLGRFFGKPAKFIFKHRLLQSLPLQGFMLGRILGLPLNSPLSLGLIGGDFGLKLLSRTPILRTIRNSALWGGAIGAEIALITGQNIAAYAAAGAGIGASIQGLNLLASFDVPAFYYGNQAYFTPQAAQLSSTRELAYSISQSKKFPSGFRPHDFKPTANFWNIANKGDYLASRFPRLANNRLFNRLFSNLNSAKLGWIKQLRYLRGGLTGTIIGTQIFLMTGNPVWIALGAGVGIGAQRLWEKTLATWTAKTSGAVSTVTRLLGKYILGPINAIAGLSFAMSSYSNVLTSPTPLNIITNVALTGGAILALAAIPFIGWGAALIIVGTALLAEAIAHQFGFSVIGWIKTNVFAPIGKWLGKIFAPLFRTIGDFLNQVASGALGFFMGIFQALTATNIQDMAAGWTAAAVSIGMIGTVLLTTIAGSGFFSIAEREIARGLLYFDANKSLVSTITDPTTQLTTATYHISYFYKTPAIDSKGKSIYEPARVTITDQYLTPEKLDTYDIKVVDYSPSSSKISKSPYYHSPAYITISRLDPISPGESGAIDLSVQFTEPIPQLLAKYNTSAICNQAVLSVNLSGIDAELTTPVVCFNADSDFALIPPEIIAVNLTKLINECYTKPLSADALIACEQLYLNYYNISPSILNILKNILLPYQYSYLDKDIALPFIQTVELAYDRQFPEFDNMADYKNTCITGGYTYYSGTKNIKPGDIIFVGQPYGIALSDSSSSSINYTDGSTSSFNNTFTSLGNSVSALWVDGYLRYDPTCP